MNKFFGFIIFLLFMIFLASAEKLYAQEKTTDCGAGILTVLKGDMLTITALYKNNAQEPVYYYHELVVKRSGGSNISSNTQTGRISVQPGIEKSLAESTINILPGDTIDLELKIIDNNKVICTTKHQFVAPKSDIQKP